MATELRIRGFDTPSSPSSLYGFVDFVPRRRGRRIRTEAMTRTRQDKEQQEAEVAAVEDSFPVREAAAAPPTEEGGFDEELTLAGEDGDWVIRLEQSFNVFLTDTVILILDTLYRGRDYARFFVPRPWPGCRILVRKVDMLDGVTILRSGKVKDEIVLDGNDIELVSRSVALIN